MTLLDKLEPGRKADINRKRLFRRLQAFSAINGNLKLKSTTMQKALYECGYVLSDFNNDELEISNITKITQIPLKIETTGILTITQAKYQPDENLFVIKNKLGSTLVIKESSLPISGEGTIVTSTDLANTDTTIFGGDIDISKNNIHVKDISAGDISCNDISANDICANKIYYSNMFLNDTDLPEASDYHGMFAHVHTAPHTGAYYSHDGNWVELADQSSTSKSFTAYDISANSITLPATGNSQIKITSDGNINTLGYVDISGYFNTTKEVNSTSPNTGSITTRGGVGISGNLVVGGSRDGTDDMVMGISSEGIGVGGTFGSPEYILPLTNGPSGNVLTCQNDKTCIWGVGGGGGGGGGSSQWTPETGPTRIYYDNQVGIGGDNTLDTEIKLYVVGDTAITKNITAYYSDERLKTFQGKIPNAIKKINQLNGYYFVENELAKSLGYNNDKVQVGVSAQEVEKVLPEIVTQAPIDKKYKTVWYDKLTPLLIEGIKEQQQQIESQQQQIENQQQQIDELKSLINK